MQTLADFTTSSLLHPQLHGASATEVIQELCGPLCLNLGLCNSSDFLQAVLAREELCSTACEPGWALPHARMTVLPHLAFALGRVSSPLRWIGGQKPAVRLVWLFAVPELETRAYLNLIAAVAKLSQDRVQLEQLMQAPDADSIFSVLQQVPVRSVQSAQPTLARM